MFFYPPERADIRYNAPKEKPAKEQSVIEIADEVLRGEEIDRAFGYIPHDISKDLSEFAHHINWDVVIQRSIIILLIGIPLVFAFKKSCSNMG